MIAEVALPLPLYQNFYYKITDELINLVCVGSRVVVPFRNKYLTGFVINILDDINTEYEIKPIFDVLDIQPVLSDKQLSFFRFIADYYITPLGLVLDYANIPGTDIKSEDIIIPNHDILKTLSPKNDTIKHKILSVLSTVESISISQLKKSIGKTNITGILKELQSFNAIKIQTIINDKQIKEQNIKFIRVIKSYDEIKNILSHLNKRSIAQIELGLFIIQNNIKQIEYKKLLEIAETTPNAIKGLCEKQILEIYYEKIDRIFENQYKEENKTITLTDLQKNVFNQLKENIDKEIFTTFLLYGVTGSGKTQIYIEVVKEVLKKNKTAVILVPEISLTPQITARFQNNFGDLVTFIHSKMTVSYKHDIWKGILDGKYKIVIGPRSALFTPLENIGVIIVDEEHDPGYKQTDQMPTYNARDLAVLKGKIYNATVILGSATPSFESYYNTQVGKYKLITLLERVKNKKLPDISIVDLKKNFAKYEYFSQQLIDNIEKRLAKKEGIIILQNRKGFAPRIVCKDCGNIHQCPYCSVTLVYHVSTNVLKCHYCGYSINFNHCCLNCGSGNYKMIGSGTEKIEDELSILFPDARIERIDSESISNKDKLPKILNDFKNKKIDILVGTQLLSKGLDFPHLTLVGVINADLLLSIPDYKTEERTMQILSQVAGRAGRDNLHGEVIIQSFNPSQEMFQYLKNNDYITFVENKLKDRKILKFPPYIRMVTIEIKSKDMKEALNAANFLYKSISSPLLDIKQPTEAPIFKLNGFYRYKIILKNNPNNDKNAAQLKRAILQSLLEFQKHNKTDVKILVDVDPL